MANIYRVEELTAVRYSARSFDGDTGEPVMDYGVFTTGAKARDAILAAAPDAGVDYVAIRGRKETIALDPLFPPGHATAGPEPLGVTMAAVAESELVRACRGAFAGLRMTLTVSPSVDYTVANAYHDGSTFSDHYSESGDSVATLTVNRNAFAFHLPRDGQHRPALGTGGLFPGADTYVVNPSLLRPGLSQGAANGTSTTWTEVATTTSPGHSPVTNTYSDAAQYARPGSGSPVGGWALDFDFDFGFLRSDPGRPCRLYLRARAAGPDTPAGTSRDFSNPGYRLWVFAPLTTGDSLAFYGVDGGYGVGVRPPDHDPAAGGSYTTRTETVAVDQDGPVVLGVTTRVWGWWTRVVHDYDHDAGAGNTVGDHGTEERVPTVAIAEL